jgi:lipopolysaccharide/colanic/teichoic acid biosynthesis glycosyltransferase
MNLSETRHILVAKNRRAAGKRAFDIAVSSSVLLALAPLMLAIALLVRVTSRGPALFRHRRIGLFGKEFHVYKFRTMRRDAEKLMLNFTPEQQAEFSTAYKLKNDPRVTALGKFLRKTSLDELPQFINVLKGEMSIVGPRPITRSELEKYGIYAEMLLSVNPGITGLWQVSGRSSVAYDDRVALDIRYVTQTCFLMDLKIFLATFRAVASRLGAY